MAIITSYYKIVIGCYYALLRIHVITHCYIIIASTHVTQDSPGYPAVQLRLTCDQICTGSEQFHVKYGAKEKKGNGNNWEPCQQKRSMASNQHWTLDIIYVL